MLKVKCILLALALLVCRGAASGKVLFIDDFEKDEIGVEPSNWEQLNFAKGNSKITIAEDPQNPQNKVAETIGIGLYIPKAAGREDWADYIWEFDWMWENDDHVGTIYRVEDVEGHYHGSRRKGGDLVNIYTRMGGSWSEIASGEYKTENGVWYRHRLVIKGRDHAIYLKPRDDDTPFENSEPVVTVDDGTFKKGPIGMMGITSGVSYYDNMVVVETLEDLKNVQAVEYAGKLAVTWGGMKDR